MEVFSSDLSLVRRTELIVSAKEALGKSCQEQGVDFSLLVHGSGVYGYQEGLEDQGGYGDVDCLAVFPDNISYEDAIVQLSSILDEVDENSVLASSLFENGLRNDVLFRIQGVKKSVPTSMYCITLSSFRSLISPLRLNSINMYSSSGLYGKKAYLERDIVSGTDSVTPTIKVLVKDDLCHAIKEHIFHEISELKLLGLLGDKWLTGEVVFDGTGAMEREIILLWRNFVRACLYHHPAKSNEEIFGLLNRSHRFSPKYREKLLGIIKRERERLLLQLAKRDK